MQGLHGCWQCHPPLHGRLTSSLGRNLFVQELAGMVQGMMADEPPAKADTVIAEVRLC